MQPSFIGTPKKKAYLEVAGGAAGDALAVHGALGGSLEEVACVFDAGEALRVCEWAETLLAIGWTGPAGHVGVYWVEGILTEPVAGGGEFVEVESSPALCTGVDVTCGVTELAEGVARRTGIAGSETRVEEEGVWTGRETRVVDVACRRLADPAETLAVVVVTERRYCLNRLTDLLHVV